MKRSSILPKKRWRGTRWLAGCAPEVIVGPLVHLQLSGFTSNPAKKSCQAIKLLLLFFLSVWQLALPLALPDFRAVTIFCESVPVGIYNGGIDFPRDLLLEPTQLTLFIAEKHMFLQHWHCWQFHTLL